MLDIGKGETPTQWQDLARIKKPVADGALAEFEAERLRDSSVWTLRLKVEHKNGTVREVRLKLELGGS